MKIKKSILAIVLVLVIVCSMGIGAMAGGVINKVTAYTNANVDITLNGESFVPKDADGNAVPIIIYNDRTYLPVRALGEAVGMNVDWKGETETVILGEDKDAITVTSLGFSTAIDTKTNTPTDVKEAFTPDTAKVYNVINLDSVKANTKISWTWSFDGEVVYETSTTTVDAQTNLNAYSAIYFTAGKTFEVGTYTVDIKGTYYGNEVFSTSDSFTVAK